MRITIATLAALLALAVAGCGSGETKAEAPTPELQAVVDHELAEIGQVKNCAKLQRGFDRNMGRYEKRDPDTRADDPAAQAEFAYAKAYQTRMEKVC